MDKFRIRVLQNGTDSFDVSAQSEDHALPIDPLMVDRIEVLRGSSALLYGGSAIGGVVNVIDRNIPTSLYDSPSASLLSSYSSVNEGLSYGASLLVAQINLVINSMYPREITMITMLLLLLLKITMEEEIYLLGT